MSSPVSISSLDRMSTVTTPDEKVNGNGLPTGSVSKLFGDGNGNGGSGTPIGFQRYLHNKHLDHVVRTPVRQPSPQLTHLGVPGTHHRVLSEEDPGYVAATFEGKHKQMEEGKLPWLGALSAFRRLRGHRDLTCA
jgi:glutamate dehydrogenase